MQSSYHTETPLCLFCNTVRFCGGLLYVDTPLQIARTPHTQERVWCCGAQV
jgi:hypothetical protein